MTPVTTHLFSKNRENDCVDGGADTDTLWFKEAGNIVDLRGSDVIYNNLEIIDLTAEKMSKNAITLDASTVENMTDGNNQLTINGRAIDAVALQDGDFTSVGVVVPGYNRYTAAGGIIVDIQIGVVVSSAAPIIDLDMDDSAGLSGSDYQVTFSGAPINIADNLDATLVNSDGANLQSMTLRITNLKEGASESLSVTPTGSMTATYSPTGVLQVIGLDTVANYQATLRDILYDNSALSPNTNDRTIEVTVVDEAGISNTATAYIRFSDDIDLTTLNGLNGHVLTGRSGMNDYVGGDAIFVGDVNSDGFDDFVVTSQANTDAIGGTGEAYLIFGTDSGLPANFDISAIGVTVPGLIINPYAGTSLIQNVASVGDFNGDGIDDFAVTTIDFGRDVTYIILGDSALTGPINLEFSYYATDYIALTDFTGTTVENIAQAGDFNGDGFMDFMVSDGSAYGSVHVVFGSTEDYVGLNYLGYDTGFHITGTATDIIADAFNSAGDINGDGFSDILISSVNPPDMGFRG